MKKMSLLVPCFLLCGCGNEAEGPLENWMAEVRKQTQPQVQKIPQSENYQAYQYEIGGRIDPYDPQKLAAGYAADRTAGGGLQPDLERQREPLEAYPLDVLKMAGSLQRRGLAVGLIEVDKNIYQVRVGSHVGQDLGKVIAINSAAIEIEEMIQDASGGWSRRRAQILLQEKGK